MSNCTCFPDEERERLRLLRGWVWVVPDPAGDAKRRAERRKIYERNYRWSHRPDNSLNSFRLLTPELTHCEKRRLERKEELKKRELKREERHKKERERQRLAGRRFQDIVYLNEIFEGCDRHHMDERRVACIPHELHESIRHNLATGYNMQKINALACEWMTEGWT